MMNRITVPRDDHPLTVEISPSADGTTLLMTFGGDPPSAWEVGPGYQTHARLTSPFNVLLGAYDPAIVAMIRDVADAEVARVKGESWREALTKIAEGESYPDMIADAALDGAVTGLRSDTVISATPEARMVPTVAADRCEAMERVVRTLAEWSDKYVSPKGAIVGYSPLESRYGLKTILDDARAALGDAR